LDVLRQNQKTKKNKKQLVYRPKKPKKIGLNQWFFHANPAFLSPKPRKENVNVPLTDLNQKTKQKTGLKNKNGFLLTMKIVVKNY
jgi:hypothetical protein